MNPTETITPEIVQEAPKHAVYGPSTLKLRELCPGWRNDRTGDTTAADEGTKLHLAVETGIIPPELDEEQKRCVMDCLAYLAAVEKGATIVCKEQRLNILQGLTFGTADRVIIFETAKRRLVTIVDFKFGRASIDDADTNRQGIAYVLGVFEEYKADAVVVTFLIPRRDEVLSHRFERSDIPRLELIIRTIIARCDEFSQSEDPTMLRPSEEACLYCGYKGRCPALNSYAMTTAKKYEPLEVVDEVHSSAITDPSMMAKAFTLARIMERWAESVKKHALSMVLEGQEIPGYEIRERSATREINNPILALPAMREFLTDEEIIVGSKVSLSKLEKIVSEKAPKGQKTKAIADLNRKLLEAECVTNGEPIRFLQKSKV